MSCSCIFFSYLVGLNIYLQLTASGRPGVIGHHAPKHVEEDLRKNHKRQVVDHNVEQQQGDQEGAVMNKIAQLN